MVSPYEMTAGGPRGKGEFMAVIRIRDEASYWLAAHIILYPGDFSFAADEPFIYLLHILGPVVI